MHQILLRQPKPEDFGFIVSAWLSSFSRSDHVRWVPPEFYRFYQKQIIASLLRESFTILAVSEDDPELIYSFITYEPDYDNDNLYVHYLYTKKAFRTLGIASNLIAAMKGHEAPVSKNPGLYFTHCTQYSKNFFKHGFKFEPKILRRILSEIIDSSPHIDPSAGVGGI